MAKLVIISEPLVGTAHELGESWTTIGRADNNMLQIGEGSVSGQHCEVKTRGEELLVRDLNSTNGTFVGEMRVSEGIVKFGQIFRLGKVAIRFENSPAVVPKISVMGPDAPAPQAVMVLPPKPAETGAETGPRYQVLFVDDSMAFLESFATLCVELSGHRWQVHTATTADRALTILAEHPIDLAVLDIKMPMLDGLQLLALIRRRHPQLKVAVMTGSNNESNRAAALANGAELFLEKPSGTGNIQLAFNMLDDILQWTEHKEGFSGALQRINLPDVIQLECLNRNSLILEIHNPQSHGQIFIEAGEITHAAVGSLTGEQAFYKLLQLKGGQFQVKPFKAPPQRTIAGHWEILLMDAARASDEFDTAMRAKQALKDAAPPPPVPTLDASLGTEVIVAATYDGEWKPTGNGS